MGTKQLLIIIFIACHQIAWAGNGVPAKKHDGDFDFKGSHQKSIHLNFHIQEVPGTTDQAGFKGQERYYMKNTLNVLKKPLYAMNAEPLKNLAMIKPEIVS